MFTSARCEWEVKHSRASKLETEKKFTLEKENGQETQRPRTAARRGQRKLHTAIETNAWDIADEAYEHLWRHAREGCTKH